MSRITSAIKATYNFFVGDMIILAAVLLAFVVVGVLGGVAHAPNVLLAVIFIGLIVAGLTLTLSREVVGRERS